MTTVYVLRLLTILAVGFVALVVGMEVWQWVKERGWDLYYWLRYGTRKRL